MKSDHPLRLDGILGRNAADPVVADKTALIWGARHSTYAQVDKAVNQLAHLLLGRGVQPGDRIGVLGRNSDTYVLIYFALARIGAIMVPINFWYRSGEIAYTMDQAGCGGLLVEGQFSDALPDLAEHPTVKWIEYFGAAIAPASDRSLEEAMAAAPTTTPDISVAETDPHIVLYTSGTTGFPKGATFCHRNHYRHAMALVEATHGEATDVGAVIYPLFHTGGFDCLVLPHFLTGSTLVILDGGDPADILNATERHKVTNIFCVPTVWRRLLATLREHPRDVSSVRRCLGSSDVFPPDLLDDILESFDADVYVTYGLTEAGCVLTVCKLTRDDRSKLGSVGRPIPGVELQMMADRSKPSDPGQVGEVTARTRARMEGYWRMPERTSETLVDGWLYSGDMGRLDEDGYLYLAGRSKDIIISGGENIYPLEIERLLKEDARIRDAAVVGVPDREWGESVLAVVVAAPGTGLREEEVIDYVRVRLAGYKKPRFVELVDELPITSATGKVQKAALRDRYREKYGSR